MRYWAWTADESHLQGARLTHQDLLKPLVDMISEADKALILKSMPVPERRERWKRLMEGGYTPSEVKAAVDHLVFVAQHMEHDLAAGGPWLGGRVILSWGYQHVINRRQDLSSLSRFRPRKQLSAR